MIGRIIAAAAIAVVFYVLIPALCRTATLFRRKYFLKELRGKTGIFASCTAYRNETLTISPVDPEAEGTGSFTVSPAKTRFFMLEKNGTLERLAWKNVFLIQNGITLSWYPGKRKHSKGLCLFHEEASKKDLALRLEKLDAAETVGDKIGPVKYFSIAVGAFLEFCVFLESLSQPEYHQVSLAALVAIFGKALPYCPPGLFFTLVAQLYFNTRAGTKKSRQRAAVGFLLVMSGVILNIGVIFFVISRVGIVLP